MSDNYLMQKGNGQMFVPLAKLAASIADGWEVVQEPDPKPEVKKVAELPPQPSVEEKAEESPVSLDEAVEKLGKKGKRAKSKKD
jgi:hypothetical protein